MSERQEDIIHERWHEYADLMQHRDSEIEAGEKWGPEASYRFHKLREAVFDPATRAPALVHKWAEPVAVLGEDGVTQALRFLFTSPRGPYWFDIEKNEAFDLWEYLHLTLVEFMGWDPTLIEVEDGGRL